MNKIKFFFRELCPPFLYRFLGSFQRKSHNDLSISFKGRFLSYQEASDKSSGYKSIDIVNHSVKEVEKYAIFRNQSCWIDTREQQLITAFGIIHLQNVSKEPMSILDFGGGAGRHYFLAKQFSSKEYLRKWTIVETETMIKAAQDLPVTKDIDFRINIENSMSSFDVIHASGVLHYMSNVDEIYELFLRLNPKFIIINRIPFIDEAEDRLTIQKITQGNLFSTIPAWFFSETKWIKKFEDRFKIMARWNVPEDVCQLDGKGMTLQGMVLKMKEKPCSLFS